MLKAEGEVARFEKVLPEYNAAPEITRTRIYLETMQDVLGKSQKIFLDTPQGSSPVLYLPIPQGNGNGAPVSQSVQPTQLPSQNSQSSNNQDKSESYPPLSNDNNQNGYGNSRRSR